MNARGGSYKNAGRGAPSAAGSFRRFLAIGVVAAACALAPAAGLASEIVGGGAGSAGAGAPAAALVEGVSWRGVRSFSRSDLERVANIRAGESLTRSQMDAAEEALVNAYRSEGYFNAEARVETSEKDRGIWVTVDVDEGRRFDVGEVELDGVTAFSRDELLAKCPGLLRGAPFSRQGLEQSFEQVLRAYGERGYAECRVSPRSFTPKGEASVDVALHIDEGRRRVVEGISLPGGRTRPSAAAKVARLRSGAAFDPWSLGEVRRRLSASGLFAQVGEPAVRAGSADSLVMIEIPVTEPPSSSVSGLLGYSGSEGGAVGFVDLQLGNIMGTGRSGGFRWESSGAGLSSYTAAYTEPWLGGLPLSLELGLDHVTQDTTYSTTGLKADVRVTAARGFSFTLGIGDERTAIAVGSGPGVTHRSRLALRGGIEVDARDNAVDPRSGAFFGVDGDWGRRRDGGPGYAQEQSWNITRVGVRSEVYRRLRGRHGLFVGASWRKVITDQSETPWDQLLRFGGASSIRGYRENQFRAEETGLLQIEHRIALGDAGSRIFLFTDLGFVGGRGAPDESLLGYGVGIRTATAGGVLGLDFALGKGDSFGDAKVHVRMTRTF